MVRLPKGTRDFPPEQNILRERIVSTLKDVFERYGYSPLDTPTFELFDVLSSKYTGGEEILKETFTFKDQGKRELGLRYDLTVPLARFIALNPRMKMPFKRYQVGEVYRDGPVASARYRQFTQCDVDVIGASSLQADVELLLLANAAFSKLDLDFEIKVNSRKLLNEILIYCGVRESKIDTVILTIDKLEKFGSKVVEDELKQKEVNPDSVKKLLTITTLKGTNQEKLEKLKTLLGETEGIKEIEEIFSYLKEDNFVFDVSLARGLAYYTGMVMEVFLKKGKVRSSVCGGGRYDNMIGSLMGKQDIPAVGISFGLDRIYDAFLETEKDTKKTVTDLFIIPISTPKESLDLAQQLRNEGIKVDVDLMGRSPSKNLNYANAFNIPFVIFLGDDEVKKGKVKLKNMKTGKESLCTIKEVVSLIANSS